MSSTCSLCTEGDADRRHPNRSPSFPEISRARPQWAMAKLCNRVILQILQNLVWKRNHFAASAEPCVEAQSFCSFCRTLCGSGIILQILLNLVWKRNHFADSAEPCVEAQSFCSFCRTLCGRAIILQILLNLVWKRNHFADSAEPCVEEQSFCRFC